MPSLSSHSNVENTALNIIISKGFQVWKDEETKCYCAEKNGWDFMGDSCMELLGLISIYEHHSPNTHSSSWWKINEPWLIDDLPTQPKDYQSVWRRR